MKVTLLCDACSCYFDTQAFEAEDLQSPLCYDCAEQAQKAVEIECAHDNVRVVRFDAGRCTQTGYVDAGEMLVCRDCGVQEAA
jgi:hypothetical protein